MKKGPLNAVPKFSNNSHVPDTGWHTPLKEKYSALITQLKKFHKADSLKKRFETLKVHYFKQSSLTNLLVYSIKPLGKTNIELIQIIYTFITHRRIQFYLQSGNTHK